MTRKNPIWLNRAKRSSLKGQSLGRALKKLGKGSQELKLCKCGSWFDSRWGKTGRRGRSFSKCSLCRRKKPKKRRKRSQHPGKSEGRATVQCSCGNWFAPRWGKMGKPGRGFSKCPRCRP